MNSLFRDLRVIDEGGREYLHFYDFFFVGGFKKNLYVELKPPLIYFSNCLSYLTFRLVKYFCFQLFGSL